MDPSWSRGLGPALELERTTCTRVQGQAFEFGPWGLTSVSARISELAAEVGVPTSTVRYYERVGLLGQPDRTATGYRDYADRLLFITRARHLGLSCDQIVDLLPVWDGVNCTAAHEAVLALLDEKRTEVAERIAELRQFARDIDEVRGTLAATPPPDACRADLSCCVPEADGSGPVPVPLTPTNRRA